MPSQIDKEIGMLKLTTHPCAMLISRQRNARWIVSMMECINHLLKLKKVGMAMLGVAECQSIVLLLIFIVGTMAFLIVNWQ